MARFIPGREMTRSAVLPLQGMAGKPKTAYVLSPGQSGFTPAMSSSWCSR